MHDDLEQLARLVVDHGFRLHEQIGPGLLESAYEVFLAASLRKDGISVELQRPIAVRYEGELVKDAFRADLLIEKTLIVEIKSVEKIAPVHAKQLLTYLRLTGLPLGLLMNFGAALFKDGVRRVINDRHAHRGTMGRDER